MDTASVRSRTGRAAQAWRRTVTSTSVIASPKDGGSHPGVVVGRPPQVGCVQQRRHDRPPRPWMRVWPARVSARPGPLREHRARRPGRAQVWRQPEPTRRAPAPRSAPARSRAAAGRPLPGPLRPPAVWANTSLREASGEAGSVPCLATTTGEPERERLPDAQMSATSANATLRATSTSSIGDVRAGSIP